MSRKKANQAGIIFRNSCKAYLLAILGYQSRMNTGFYELICEALAKDGLPRLSGSAKAWAKVNAAHIAEAIGRPDLKAQLKVNRKQRTEKRAQRNISQAAYRTSAAASNEFLESYEWRKLRMQALKLHGAKCQCCGASPATGAVLNVDHIKPRRLFPALALDLNNLQVLCHECNHGKGNWDQTDWRPDIVDTLDPEQLAHLRDIVQ